ncbi:hypothetical protein LOK74_18875 [Brevibacillus humidisoli]|uniref:hypothetical protein n=1 Tax=Brevibacillus humidisoli TaxID=2895522 RepID=UPI001E36234E|nr:hypothetical protein [Brevibacillus humidisoli]UFJ40077.1 hypothetical protein LOK74_18875 [Brevibacillus humidisoli]
MRYMMAIIMLCFPLVLTGCAEFTQSVQDAQQAVEAGKQVIETGKEAVELGKQVVETGKQLAQTEIAQELQTYLQEKYETSQALRDSMFSGDGQLVVQELQNTELAEFSFYQSDLLGIEYKGKLTADGTFQVLKYQLADPQAEPEVVTEFNVVLNSNGDIQVEQPQQEGASEPQP